MPRIPVYEQVITDITAAVEAGTLKAGEKLPTIAELCERYEASAQPIRYALRLLDERGVIESRPGVGFYVRHRGARSG